MIFGSDGDYLYRESCHLDFLADSALVAISKYFYANFDFVN
jgi:hypothetical protein